MDQGRPSPVSRSHMLRDLTWRAPLQRDGSQRSGSMPNIELPGRFQEHCKLPILRDCKQLTRSDAKWPSVATVDTTDKDLAWVVFPCGTVNDGSPVTRKSCRPTAPDRNVSLL